MFRWDDLRVFLELARRKRMNEAARALGVDQTTISRRLAALEEAVGARLFAREEAGWRLTPEGEALEPLAAEMETAARRLEEHVTHRAPRLSGVARVAAPDGFGGFFLAPRLPKLLERHPDLEIEILAASRQFNLAAREADVFISLSPPQTRGFFSRKLTDYDLGLYAARAYLKGAPPIRAREDVRTHRLIGYIDEFLFAPELRYVTQVGPDLRVRLRSLTLSAQYAACKAGGGLCVLPRFMAAPEPEFVAVLPEDIRLTRSFWLVMRDDHYAFARMRALADFIAEEVAAARALFLAS